MLAGDSEVAQPHPTSQSPSRIDPGFGSRLAQPSAAAAASKQGISIRGVYGRPLMASWSVSLTRRNSTGSVPSFAASWSIADSRANSYGISGGLRMKPGVLRSVWAIVTSESTFGQTYSQVEVSVPATR